MLVVPLLVLCCPSPAGGGQGELELTFGFEADLVAEAPQVRAPTCVYCLEDGSLLVAEQAGRIRRFQFGREGTLSDVFADGLGPVRGMEQIDGDLFVLHGRRLSRLSDPDGDGRADERERIVDGLGPEPGPDAELGGHGAGGFRMAMDGFLYLSVGERGIPRATGRDGSTVTLRGAGVLRLRPDGTRLEVFAAGVRDHVDLAIDQRGELFVYDVGPGPTTRLTHVVEGGVYGYPWETDGVPTRALPSMWESDGGGVGGGLVYTEGMLRNYRDHLFWCDPGRRTLRRFEIEPAATTFRVFHEEAFASAGTVEGFRPLDVCASADGRCFYLADGGPGADTGRIWRLRLTGDAPERGWKMQDLPRDEGALVDSLADASFRRRLRAQRAIVNLEPDEVLVDHLFTTATENQNEQKRRHALWALTELDPEVARDAAIHGFGSTEDTQVQALRAFGLHSRVPHEDMIPMLRRATPRVRREAAVVLGRIGKPDGVEHIAAAHGPERDPHVRWAIRGALADIGRWRVIDWVSLSSYPDAELLLAFRDAYDVRAVTHLTALITGADGGFPAEWTERLGPQRARALAVLAELHGQREPWDGRWWGLRPARFPAPAKSVVWEGSETIAGGVRAVLGDPSAPVRHAALEAVRTLEDRDALPLVRARCAEEADEELRLLALDVLAALQDVDAVGVLAAVVNDASSSTTLKQRAVHTARAIGTPEARELLLDVARRTELPASVQLAALHALGELSERSAEALLEERLDSPRGALRSTAAAALARVAGAGAVERLAPLLGDRSTDVAREVVEALVGVGGEAVPALLAHVEHPELGDDVVSALARLADARGLDPYLAGLGRAAVRDVCSAALRALRDELRPELERRHLAGELDVAQADALRTILLAPAPLRDWTLFGPFDRGSRAVEVPEVEGRVLQFVGEGRAARAELEHGAVDLGRALSPARDGDVFGVAQVTTAEPRGLELVVGSDDAIDVWVAGRLAHSFRGRRSWAPDQDRIEVKVGRGVQQVVVRAAAYARFSVAAVGRAEGAFFDRAPEAERAPELEVYSAFAAENSGDASRGFLLFRDARRLGCVRCHAISTPRGRLGEHLGPDLDGVADRLDRAELVEALLEPSRNVAAEYRAETLRTADGDLFGHVLSEEGGRLRLFDEVGELRELAADEVTERRPSRRSVMPAGVHARVSMEEFADLVAFLGTLRRSPEGGGRKEESNGGR